MIQKLTDTVVWYISRNTRPDLALRIVILSYVPKGLRQYYCDIMQLRLVENGLL